MTVSVLLVGGRRPQTRNADLEERKKLRRRHRQCAERRGGRICWTALAFSTEACAALMGLGLGETVALQGAQIQRGRGEERMPPQIRKALFVAAALTARGWPREGRRKVKPVKAHAELMLFDHKPEPEFDDAVPF